MTYEEALLKKVEVGTAFFEEGFEYIVYITPSRSNDFDNYMKIFKEKSLNDNDAKLFSSNNQYLLRGICEHAPKVFVHIILD